MDIRTSVYYATRQRKWHAEVIFGTLEDGRRIKKYFRCQTREEVEKKLKEYKENLTEKEFYSTKNAISQAMTSARHAKNEIKTEPSSIDKVELNQNTTGGRSDTIFYSNSKGKWIASMPLGKYSNGGYRRKDFHGHTEEEAVKKLEAYKGAPFAEKESVSRRIKSRENGGYEASIVAQKSDRLEKLIELTKSTTESLLKLSQEVYLLRGELENIKSGDVCKSDSGFVTTIDKKIATKPCVGVQKTVAEYNPAMSKTTILV
jgi:hypothetical protein